jgi:hypothetical protein
LARSRGSSGTSSGTGLGGGGELSCEKGVYNALSGGHLILIRQSCSVRYRRSWLSDSGGLGGNSSGLNWLSGDSGWLGDLLRSAFCGNLRWGRQTSSLCNGSGSLVLPSGFGSYFAGPHPVGVLRGLAISVVDGRGVARRGVASRGVASSGALSC